MRSTRLLKAQCGSCAYTVRVTRKWLSELGPPLCPCNREPMECPEFDDFETQARIEMDAWEADALRSRYRVLSEKWTRARIPHRCSKCPGEIQIGEEYHRLTYTLEGALSTTLSCLACQCRMTPAATGRGMVARA